MPKPESATMRRLGVRQIIIIAVVLALVCAAILIGGHIVSEKLDGYSSQEMIEITDEITRAKHFISDWYDEIHALSSSEPRVFLNELRFDLGYTITYAADRLRAVYPRGERFFKFDYIDSAEFFTVDNKIRCRLYYGKDGEFTFSL
ncbi:MAG: hypothetical protein IJD07_04225 [Clostridia bacterium]|nr:hypothetical protein [Clostridia bacterium]